MSRRAFACSSRVVSRSLGVSPRSRSYADDRRGMLQVGFFPLDPEPSLGVVVFGIVADRAENAHAVG